MFSCGTKFSDEMWDERVEKCHKNLVHLPGDIHSTARRGSERLQSSLRPHKICFQLITSGEGTVSNDSFVYFSFEEPFFCLCEMFLFCTEQHLLFSVFTHLMSTINLSASSDICFHFHLLYLSFSFIEQRYQQMQDNEWRLEHFWRLTFVNFWGKGRWRHGLNLNRN